MPRGAAAALQRVFEVRHEAADHLGDLGAEVGLKNRWDFWLRKIWGVPKSWRYPNSWIVLIDVNSIVDRC